MLCPLQGEGWQESPKEEILPSFYEAVCAKQQHTQKAAKFITDGVTGIVDKVQTLLVYWEKKFKPLWETDKDAFIRSVETFTMGHKSHLFPLYHMSCYLLRGIWQHITKLSVFALVQ